MVSKRRSRFIVVSFPIVVTAVTLSTMLAIGVDPQRAFAVSGMVWGLTAYLATQLGAYLASRPTEVLVISGSRSVQSSVKVRGISDVIGPNSIVSVRVVRPEKNAVLSEDRLTATHTWFKDAILQGLSSGVKYLIIDSADRVIDGVMEDLLHAGRSGRTVIVLGDVASPATLAEDAVCVIKADSAVGGFLAGQALARSIGESDEAIGILIVRAFPTHERPRAAYATLALALDGRAGRTVFLTAEGVSDLEGVLDEIKRVCENKKGRIIVACTTDSQLVILSRMLKESIPDLCDRFSFIGYDGTLDETGDLLVLGSPLHVIGTVDTKPYELGRLAGEEVLRRAGAGKRNVQLVVTPTFQSLPQKT